MDIMNYIIENALVLIPALVIIGQIVKSIEVVPNKFIPLILLVFGIGGALGIAIPLGTPFVEAVIQGVLVTGAAVYGNQVYKQLKKEE